MKKRSESERRLRQSDRLARTLRLLQLLQGRGRWNCRDLAAEFECSERTIHRQLQVLELAGVPWTYDAESRAYRLNPGWQFQPLNLTPDELLGQAVATVVAGAAGLKLGPGAGPTTAKLASALPSEHQRLLDNARRLVCALDLKMADQSRSSQAIRAVQSALLMRRQVTGQYRGPFHSTFKKVTLHPYRLCLVRSAWYLIARPVAEAMPKLYRVARFRTMRELDYPAVVPDDFDLCEYLGNAWSIYRGAERCDVELLFSGHAAVQVQETRWHHTQIAAPNEDGSVTLRFSVDGLHEILWWLLGWTGFVRVMKPDKLRRMFVKQLRAGLAENRSARSFKGDKT